MKNDLTNSEKLEEIVDKIFLQNHNLISEMIIASQDEENKRYPKLNKELEDNAVERLSEYYAELRETIREALQIADELILAEMPSVGETAKEEVKIQEREEYKDRLIEAIESRLKTMFISMNFVPIEASINGTTTEVPTFYEGKPEEFLRSQEYETIMESIYKQMEIIYFEDAFAKKAASNDTTISPYIVPSLLDAIGDKAAYAKAEEDCEKYVEQSNSQAEVYDEFPELRFTAEQVEFLRLQNKYKRRFEEAAGYLNTNTTYGEYFFNLYKTGALTFITGFSQEEIRSRVNDRVTTYSERNKAIIQEMFNYSVKKFKKFRRKRSIDETIDNIKYKLSRFSRGPKELADKKVKPQKKKHKIVKDTRPLTKEDCKKREKNGVAQVEKRAKRLGPSRKKGGEEK